MYVRVYVCLFIYVYYRLRSTLRFVNLLKSSSVTNKITTNLQSKLLSRNVYKVVLEIYVFMFLTIS